MSSLALGGLLLPATSFAQVAFSSLEQVNLNLPDGSPVGAANTQEVSAGFDTIGEVRLTLTIAGRGVGGFNGDLYAYLAHGGQIAILLNRPGRTVQNPFGYSGNGLSVTFDDHAGWDIHRYEQHLSSVQTRGAPLTGTWMPDGRLTDPNTVLDTDWPTAMLSAFRGGNPDGGWTLFVADVEAGGTSRLVSWELEIRPIPEPAFATVGTALGLLILVACRLRSGLRNQPWLSELRSSNGWT